MRTSRPANLRRRYNRGHCCQRPDAHADQYKPLIVGYNKGAAIRLPMLPMFEGAQNIRTAGYLNGMPSITVIIFRQPGANIIDTVDRVQRANCRRSKRPFRKASRPPLFLTAPRPSARRSAMWSARSSLVVLVILVVFIFPAQRRATLIPAVAVPVSLVGTFAVMYLLGFSIDNLSLMALTISTGFVVDDAIVVMENISRLVKAA
jgi:multidrug efflux pump